MYTVSDCLDALLLLFQISVTETDNVTVVTAAQTANDPPTETSHTDDKTRDVAPRDEGPRHDASRGRGEARDSAPRDAGRPNAWGRGAPRGRGTSAPRGRGGQRADPLPRKQYQKEKPLPKSIDEMPKYEEQKKKVIEH